MIIYPAIDLKEGQCVRLVQGRASDKTVYSDSPSSMARCFQELGAAWLHIVDLDGAFSGKPGNLQAIESIAAAVSLKFQVGGGLRSLEDVERVLRLGAQRVIIGSRAVTSPDFVKMLLDKFGAEKIVLGLDAKDGMVAVDGWVSTSNFKAVELGLQMKSLGIKRVVFTDISRDGVLKGPNLASIEEMARKTGLEIIASGGVSSLENIKALKAMEDTGVSGAIIGKALYDGMLNLSDALAEAH
ncbi:MAG: 1-(5-phosphoribosyl)-5-[(5-phosphoribosylamino)methylideneamino]imidazole-4-carboxamide isomerase [Syntrophomonadaceae bacterium]|nr:1-(5-phosphoribosyl)-5-[(5-phosphoribosylamino)methylideneamino]imidazole-4-carboxamide isomerase [Syntrophomonadaceae bacterium]MDD3023170.1 1-(5-phosphoribosyl)-5-[(5-phosphoribosylamino)methylideneamino]imidazole-4-carboxamide isomerase [Syntrophomonadaceae bacterium]